MRRQRFRTGAAICSGGLAIVAVVVVIKALLLIG